ncbi:hypothetical protein WRSd5_03442 [Shigella dysenteriae WRSd5]|nr:hypothetical protein WRSd5_03442 [Shigella dysenteriae WRSd5]
MFISMTMSGRIGCAIGLASSANCNPRMVRTLLIRFTAREPRSELNS